MKHSVSFFKYTLIPLKQLHFNIYSFRDALSHRRIEKLTTSFGSLLSELDFEWKMMMENLMQNIIRNSFGDMLCEKSQSNSIVSG